MQRLFYRKDRHCFFLNWLVVTDVNGFIVYSRPGFLGHLNDSTCYRFVIFVIYFSSKTQMAKFKQNKNDNIANLVHYGKNRIV